jgi:hypothetical protein
LQAYIKTNKTRNDYYFKKIQNMCLFEKLEPFLGKGSLFPWEVISFLGGQSCSQGE